MRSFYPTICVFGSCAATAKTAGISGRCFKQMQGKYPRSLTANQQQQQHQQYESVLQTLPPLDKM